MHFRHLVKHYGPKFLYPLVQDVRGWLAAPPSEELKLHDYVLEKDDSGKPRLNLVIPSVAPNAAFGGILTGLDLFLKLGTRTGADLRIILDDFARPLDLSIVQSRAKGADVDFAAIDILPRLDAAPRINVRATDVFMTFNWWVTLNVKVLTRKQSELFGRPVLPCLYLVQDYEPQFYAFSSTHMLARSALDSQMPYWGIFNSKELFDYVVTQGHKPQKSFVFEPKLSDSLRPYQARPRKTKERRILIYGRPAIQRNCFPAIRRGLRGWIESGDEHTRWDIVSAGEQHRPVPLAKGRHIRSLGKLSLDDYADLLDGTAVGISLMSSPHPSYPPLEMAHFGVLTITNGYANKDLSRAHDNIVSLHDIRDATVADAIASVCRRFEANPQGGMQAETRMPGFLEQNRFEWLDAIAAALISEVWSPGQSPRDTNHVGAA